jgi:hypothetical protein
MIMNAEQFYNRARRNGITLEHTCVGVTQRKWDSLMEGHVRANKDVVNKLVRDSGQMDPIFTTAYNPYNYFRTKTHIIFVHSGIEHFFKVN